MKMVKKRQRHQFQKGGDSVNRSIPKLLNRKNIIRHAPEAAGVYEILQDHAYDRYKNKTTILKIGMTSANLREELLRHLYQHTCANRIQRISRKETLKFKFSLTRPGRAAKKKELQLLKKFEDKYWDLPVLNSTRGYKRGEDKHYRNNGFSKPAV